MKKSFAITLLTFVLAILSFTAVACAGKQPKLQAPSEVEFYLGERVYYLDGVTAYDGEGNNMTHLITVTASDGVVLSGEGYYEVQAPGKYTVTYTVVLNDKTLVATTAVTVRE